MLFRSDERQGINFEFVSRAVDELHHNFVDDLNIARIFIGAVGFGILFAGEHLNVGVVAEAEHVFVSGFVASPGTEGANGNSDAAGSFSANWREKNCADHSRREYFF